MTANRTDKFSEIKEMTSHFDGTISWIKSDKPTPDDQSTHSELPDTTPQSREPLRQRTQRAEDNVGFFPVRGQFDSGADDNFISRSLILRANLEHLIEDPTSHLPLTVSTVIGEGTLTERLQLNLSLHGSSRSDTLLFWVSEEGTFDILIGEEWMQKNERNVFGRRAFAAGHESRLVFKPQDKGTPPSPLPIASVSQASCPYKLQTPNSRTAQQSESTRTSSSRSYVKRPSTRAVEARTCTDRLRRQYHYRVKAKSHYGQRHCLTDHRLARSRNARFAICSGGNRKIHRRRTRGLMGTRDDGFDFRWGDVDDCCWGEMMIEGFDTGSE
jgi:hypothetical protein